MNISKTAKRLATTFVVLAVAGAPLTACSSDDNSGGVDAGSGGSAGKGTGGSAGKSTGGSGGQATGGSGGVGGKATGGAGGMATGGTGGKTHLDGGPDGDAGCVSPQALYYDKAGCNGTVAPVCAGPTFDACDMVACSCDGETISGCGYFEKAYAHLGECTDAGKGSDGGDAGKDGGDGG